MRQLTPVPRLGFPPNGVVASPTIIARPTPLPKRPKRRWFVGAVLLAIVGVVVYTVWNSYFRYQAYGTVTGHMIQVSPPWNGVLQYLQVQEGTMVRQGQLLLTVDNIDLRQRHAQIGDELRVAQANLEAEAAKLKWQVAFNLDQGRGALALYYEACGNLIQEQARLDDLRTQLRRAEILMPGHAISQQEMQQIRFATEGQVGKIAKIKEAIAEWKLRSDQTNRLLKKGSNLSTGLDDNGFDQLRPLLIKIETLEAERGRLQDRLDQGQVRAPTNGLVVKVHHFAGEHCKADDALLSLLEEGSLEVLLYMSQKVSTLLAKGAEVSLILDPYPEPLMATVVRLGDQYEPAPEHLKRHYREGQKLLTVHLKPQDEAVRWMALRVGGVVKLPYRLIPFGPGAVDD